VTTSTYNAIANLHNLQFTTSRTMSSHSAVSSPLVTWWRIPTMSSASMLVFLRLPNVSQLTHCSKCSVNNISARTAQKTQFCVAVFIVAFASVGIPTWSLLNHCLGTAVVYRAITYQRLLYNSLCRGRCLARGLDAAVYWAEEFSPHRHPVFIISSHMSLCQTLPNVVPSCFRMNNMYEFLFSPIRATWTAHFTVLDLSY
jgi:hypothetical protein